MFSFQLVVSLNLNFLFPMTGEGNIISMVLSATVELPITDPPRSGQSLYNEQTWWNGLNLA